MHDQTKLGHKAQKELMHERGYITILEAMELAGLHRSTIATILKRKNMKSKRIGGSIYIEALSYLIYLGPDCAVLGIPDTMRSWGIHIPPDFNFLPMEEK